MSFGNVSGTNTTATFSTPGSYMLMLGADDSIHGVVYDAVVMNVASGITISGNRSGQSIALTWTGGSAPYSIERATSLPAVSWTPVITTNSMSATLPMTGPSGFFRVRSQ